MNKKVVVSLFNGIGVGNLALDKKYDVYLSSEIDEDAIKVTQHHFPETIQMGDVRNIDSNAIKEKYGNIHLLIGGSPCTDFSFAGKQNGMTTTTNIEITTLEQYLELKSEGFTFNGQSYLLWEYMNIRRIIKPKYFLLENVKMSTKWKQVITDELGVKPHKINSKLFSAQNRDRLYWTNIPFIGIPQNNGQSFYELFGGISCGSRGYDNGNNGYDQKITFRKDDKGNCLVTGGRTNMIYKNDKIRNLTPLEFEILQTLPVGYTNIDGISNTSRKRLIGNSWTTEVIKHLVKNVINEK